MFKRVLGITVPVAIAGVLTALPGVSQAATSPGWRVTAVLPDNSTPMAVAATGRGNAWTAGTVCSDASCDHMTLLVRHWNGKAWTAIPVPKAEVKTSFSLGVTALAAPPASSAAWILTDTATVAKLSPTIVLHWTGKGWGTTTLPAGVEAAVAPSATNAWAFGVNSAIAGAVNPPYAAHYDGRKWSPVKVPLSGVAASATTAKDVWVIGSMPTTAQPGVMAFNGRTWRTTPLPGFNLSSSQGAVPTSIAAVSTRDVWAAGYIIDDSQQIDPPTKPFLLHWNGTRWAAVKVPYAGMTEGNIAPDGRGGVWLGVTVLGNGTERGYILHYRNGAWTRAAMAARDGEVTDPTGLASIPGTQSAWGVGQEFPLAPMLDAYPGVILKYGP